mmetsp:Transcript_2447/g.4535  ORF Transcript_2447/g.4535 Transcript_2447/m.4535 type:complete len:1028 (+) Transcript_2447:112-3195(+)
MAVTDVPMAFLTGKGMLSSAALEASDARKGSVHSLRQEGVQSASGAQALVLAALGCGASIGLVGALSGNKGLCGRVRNVCGKCRRSRIGMKSSLRLPTQALHQKKKATVVAPLLKSQSEENIVGMKQFRERLNLRVDAGMPRSSTDPGLQELAMVPVNSITPTSEGSSSYLSPISGFPQTPVSVRHRLGVESCPSTVQARPVRRRRRRSHTLPPRPLRSSQPELRMEADEEASATTSPTSSCANSNSPQRRRMSSACEMPDDTALEDIFTEVSSEDGYLSRDGVALALQLAEENLGFPSACLGLRPSTPMSNNSPASNEENPDTRADRLFQLLAQTKEGEAVVTRAGFVSGMKELVEVANGLGGLSAAQVREVLLLAFERFDDNEDGKLSIDEFAAATGALGMNLSPAVLSKLHALLDTDGDGYIEHDAANTSELDRWIQAFQASMNLQMQHRAKKFMPLVESFRPSQEEETPVTKVASNDSVEEKEEVKPAVGPVEEFLQLSQRAKDFVVDKAEAVADAVEASLDMTGAVLAMQAITRELAGVDSWEQLDVGELSPFLVFLGVSGLHMMREVNKGAPAKDLSADEALLYVQSFQAHGFSVAEFRELLQAGFRWVDLPRGASPEDDGQLLIVLRGDGRASASPQKVGSLSAKSKAKGMMKVRPGAVLKGAAQLGHLQRSPVVAKTEMRLAAWDQDGLRKFLKQRPAAARRLFALFRRAKRGQRTSGTAAQASGTDKDNSATAKLKEAFDKADVKGKGKLDLNDMQVALRNLAKEHGEKLQIEQSDEVVTRLSKILLRRDSSIDRKSFVVKLQQLACRVEAARGSPISEIREILGLGIETMLQESSAGPAQSSPCSICSSEAMDSDEDDSDGQFQLPDIERVANAFHSAMQETCRRKGLDRIGAAIAGIATGVTSIGSDFLAGEQVALAADASTGMGAHPIEAVKTALEYAADQPEVIQEFLTNSLDVASLLTASSRLCLELCSQESLSDIETSTVVTLLVFVGLSGVYMARDLSNSSLADDKVPKRA